MFHHRIEIFVDYIWLVGFLMLNASLVMMFDIDYNLF